MSARARGRPRLPQDGEFTPVDDGNVCIHLENLSAEGLPEVVVYERSVASALSRPSTCDAVADSVQLAGTNPIEIELRGSSGETPTGGSKLSFWSTTLNQIVSPGLASRKACSLRTSLYRLPLTLFSSHLRSKIPT
jgi:hypothetical protein